MGEQQVNLANYTPQSANRPSASETRRAAVHISPNTSGASVLPGAAAADMVALHSIATAGEAFPSNAQLCVLSSRTFVRCACAASSQPQRPAAQSALQQHLWTPRASFSCMQNGPSCQCASKLCPAEHCAAMHLVMMPSAVAATA